MSPGQRAKALWRTRPHALACAGLVLLSAVVLSPLLAAGRAPYSPYSDFVAQHLATKRVAYQSLHAGHGVPLWRDDQLGGSVALTNPQALYLDPLHALFWVLPPEAAVGPTFALLLLVAALGTYAFACSLGASSGASLFAGVCTLLSAKLLLAVYAGWLAPLATIALVPWLLFAVTRLCEAPGPARAAVLAAVCALAFAGGTPQTLYYALLLGLPYAAVAADSGKRVRGGLTALLWIAVALGLGVACNAYLWGAVASDFDLLTRSASSDDPAFFHSGHALGLRDLWTLFIPPALRIPSDEPWEEVAYFGLVPLALSTLSLGSKRTRYFGIALLASLLLSLDTPLLTVLRAVLPGYAQFRLPARMLFVTSFLGIALCASGLDRLMQAISVRSGARAASVTAALLTLGVLAEGHFHTRQFLQTAPRSELIPDRDHPLRAAAAHAQRGMRAAVLGDAISFGWAADLGLRLINGYDPYHYVHQAVVVGLLEHGQLASPATNWVRIQHLARRDLLDELSVELVISNVPVRIPGCEPIAASANVRSFHFYEGMRTGPLFIYRNTQARPYARFATKVEALPTDQAIVRRMAGEPLSGQAYIKGQSAPAADGGRASLKAYRPGFAQISTHSKVKQLLVAAETYHPGWQAKVDGIPTPVTAVNLTLTGIWLHPGDHRVELEFRPNSLPYDAAVSLTALAVTALVLLTTRRRPL